MYKFGTLTSPNENKYAEIITCIFINITNPKGFPGNNYRDLLQVIGHACLAD